MSHSSYKRKYKFRRKRPYSFVKLPIIKEVENDSENEKIFIGK
jgi:hypothetical protein